MAKGFGKGKQKRSNKKRQQAYLKVIFALLNCPPGREAEILMRHPNLIDAGLVKMMTMVAMTLLEKGDRQVANFLMNIAQNLTVELGLAGNFSRFTDATNPTNPAANSEGFALFLAQVMITLAKSNGNPEAAYPILQAYLEQDRHFIQRFRSWGITQLDQADGEKIEGFAVVLNIFGSVICEFPLGDRMENVEEAIACHQAALQVISREGNPQLWGDTQNRLAIAYSLRIKGDQAENLETAIDAAKKALQVLTQETSPEEWGKIKNNLGNLYRDRIWGDKAENLEQSIAAYQNALQVRTRAGDPIPWAMTQMNLAVAYRHRIKGDKAINLDMAIAACQAALQVYTRTAFPQGWAKTQTVLGNIYCYHWHQMSGEPTENLNNAITAYNAALQVFTRQSFPHDWALTQMNLGNAYRFQHKITDAIACFQAALEIWTPTEFPQQCWRVASNMGYMAFEAQFWLEAIVGFTTAIAAIEQNIDWADSESRRQEIKAEAFDIYEKLVQACVNNGQPELAKDYAERSGRKRLINQLKNNQLDSNDQVVRFLFEVLRQSYDNFDQPQVLYSFLAANLDKLDQSFIQALRGLGKYIQSKIKPEQFAQFYRLATTDLSKLKLEPSLRETFQSVFALSAFRDMLINFNQGNRGTNIEIAITCHEVVGDIVSRDLLPEIWAAQQNDLGGLYQHRIHGDRGSNIEQAIQYYQNALQIFTPESSPEMWGNSQNNLAIAYRKRIHGDRAQNLEQAIRCCQTVLHVCSRETFPEQWANTHNNLVNLYRERVGGEPSENLELAIKSGKNALFFHTRETSPENWAMLNQNLGIVYANRIKGDPTENLEAAIQCFQKTLEIRTREAFTLDWVSCQTSMGIAYEKRIVGDSAENIELAIHCYKTALEIATIENMPEQWAMAQINLASAYSWRLRGNQTENVNSALNCYKAASQVYTKRAYPQNWATLQNNLANLYGKLGLIEQKIHCLQKSLDVCTRAAFPKDWADTQYNLAHAYHKLGLVDQAISCLKLSLDIFQPTVFPVDCLMSGRLLGDITFKAQRWDEAIEGYNLAIEAVETSRSWVTSDFRRQEILAESLDIYDNMVQACINAGQLEKALETVERSRAKRLVDLMASNDLYQSEEIAPDVKELLQKFDNLQQRIDQERTQKKSSNNRELMGMDSHRQNRAAFQAENDAIASLEADKLHVWEQLRRLDPVLAGEIKVDAPNFAQIQQLIDQPTTAILSFYTTTNDLHLFILRQNKLTLHTCPGQGINTLQHFISQNWLQPYIEDKFNWKSNINSFLSELSQRLQLTELMTNHLQGINELIIIPHLLLHQIPFAALPILNSSPNSNKGEIRTYFGDRFLIRYTPSCQILTFCQQRRDRERFCATQYGTVEDATDDLPFASFEGEQIARLHNIPDNLRLKGKTQATVKNYRQLVHQVQVIHSSHHAEFRLDNPLESVLKLADSHITLGQLMTPGWRLPDLFDVFLSCCETGLGLPEITDDILTLSTGFLCAGARSVVSTLWSVADLATALFSIFYYQQRQQGKSRPEALRQAQIQLRELKKDELLNREDIKEFCQQAEVKWKEARRKRNQCQPDSSDYFKWESDYRKYYQITKQIQAIKTDPDEYLFSQPQFWAAFTCQGLR
ncbi:MAG: tetratricopeptide repeat protein [Coleofasciculus sp. D1-CHI-01]|uniref:CHAT domain-containing protein n=1 Tax=Coleofasciculus sp. D1-CHI-01 TaxID=3068482 RepID=UPI0032F1F269